MYCRIRRFFCDNAECQRRIFAERLDPAIAPYARRTRRLEALLESVGLALGGKPGVPLARRSGMPVSASTLLRILRRAPEPVVTTPRVLGVDDWAKRKRHTYGTILVDLEQHRPIDLLPDRKPESLAEWLREHPGVEIITRDRSGDYAQGATAGAPQAVQVADRWHLLGNCRDAVQRLLDRHPDQLRKAAKLAAESETATELTNSPPASSLQTTSPSLEPVAPRADMVERYERVKALQREGQKSLRAMARQLHLNRATVRRYAQADGIPGPGRGPQSLPSALPYLPYLQQRWSEGYQNYMQLWHEIREQGYTGSYSSVQRVLVRFPKPIPSAVKPARSLDSYRLSSPQASWLLFRSPDDLTPEEERTRAALCIACPTAATAYPLAQSFRQIVRERQVENLDSWLGKAADSNVPELKNFSGSLRRDYDAVRAALALPWSNGPVEGHVNRLKTVKRAMYGRGNFDLLRRRVLYSRT